MDQESKDQAIRQYIQWATNQQEFKDKLNHVLSIYWNYYSQDEDGFEKTIKHWEKEENEKNMTNGDSKPSIARRMPLGSPRKAAGAFK